MSADPELKMVEGKGAVKKGGMMKTILLLVVGLIVIGGGGGGAWWWLHRDGDTVAAAAKEPALETRGLLKFDPFMVNLADEGGARFLKANISLVLEDTVTAKKVEESPVVVSRLRSDILELLTEQSAAPLVTPEGKDTLKKAIKARASDALQDKKVIDVLFSEFVVQF